LTTIPPPTPSLVVRTMHSLLERQASAGWMSPDVVQYIESNKLLLVEHWPTWSITLTAAGTQFIRRNGKEVIEMPKFKFKLTYCFRAVYTVLDWGQEWHDKCVAFYSTAPDYEADGNGSRVWNYTEEEFKRYVLGVVGYLHWDGHALDGAPPIEWAHQLNAMFREQFELARKRFPDTPPENCFQLLGVAEYLLGSGWVKTDLPCVTEP
jgi:hypothetical protein